MTTIPLFIDKPEILYAQDQLFEVLPLLSMSKEEKMNSTMRLVIYAVIAMVFTRKITVTKAFAILAAITASIWALHKYSLPGSLQQFLDILDSARTEHYGLATDPSTIETVPMVPTAQNPFANQLFGHKDLPQFDDNGMTQDNKDKMNAMFEGDDSKSFAVTNPYAQNRRQDARNFYHVPELDRDAYAKYIHQEYINEQTTAPTDGHRVPKIFEDLKSSARIPIEQINAMVQEDTGDSSTFLVKEMKQSKQA